jgi:AbrB family looped-hinge helix DNA binding protein
MPIVRISERGQMVIPQDIRQKLGLQKGSMLFLDFSEPDQTILLRPAGPGAGQSLRGFLKGTNVMELRLRERRREIAKDERRARR